MPRPDPARNVHLPLNDVRPESIGSIDQGPIPRVEGHIGHGTVQVHRPHRVADDFRLLSDGHVVLIVWPPQSAPGFVAPEIQEEPCEIEISFFSRCLVKFHQGQFDLFVAAKAESLRRSKRVVDTVGIPRGHAKKRAFAGGAPMGDGGLEQVAGTIQLVLVLQVGPALSRLGQGIVRVEVSIRLLRGGNFGNRGVNHSFQRGIAIGGQGVGRALDQLEYIGIVGAGALVIASDQLCGLGEVADASRLLAALEDVWNRLVAIDSQSRGPKRVVKLHRGVWYGR